MDLLHKIRQIWQLARFKGSGDYWEERYRLGGTSGDGSYGRVAEFKASVLNDFVEKNQVQTIIELGCGDGGQLELAKYPSYLGLDVSQKAIEICRKKFAGDATKFFASYKTEESGILSRYMRSDLTISQDVIYHLVEDEIYESYMKMLFAMSQRYVAVFSSNYDEMGKYPHVKHRKFTKYIEGNVPAARCIQMEKMPIREDSFADFYIFQKSAS